MARAMHKLSARFVATATEAGRHGDGAGLYLSISPNGGRRWTFLFRQNGKLREMGLGSARDVSLAKARERAQAARDLLADGQDPLAVKRTEPVAEPERPNFGAFADSLVASLVEGFSNPKHRQQWTNTLTTYAVPLRDKALDEISTTDILEILQPLWQTKPETASRLRGRIERILSAAKAKGLISSPWENPARWRGHLDQLLSKRQRLTRGRHAALDYDQISGFVAKLRARSSLASLALEFTILTAGRTGEVLGAQWREIDLAKTLWTVPAGRMKARREHRVPLAKRACDILSELAALRPEGDDGSSYVFPGLKSGRPLSGMSMEMLLRRMGRPDITVHGFRSTFRDWAAECTPFANEVCESALAHTIGNKAEAAYRRGDLFEKRRALMSAWSDYCDESAAGNVIQIRRG
ncbi:MAG: integrase arm-type DNA-binding domain-containing protein [Beijerinckiaceae bacterium]|nr:integrase arm-type DNA-binding domain-containing protein [Beijerinckiaceae bacterium]